jgi:hypothetical protein
MWDDWSAVYVSLAVFLFFFAVAVAGCTLFLVWLFSAAS